MVARSSAYPGLCFYLGPVLEGDPHIVLAVDRDEIHKADPEHWVELCDHAIQRLQFFQEILNCRLPSGFVTYGYCDRVQPSFGFVEPSGQPVVAFLVFRLIERYMSVFLNALLQELGDHQQFTLQLIPLCSQRRCVEGCALGKIECADDVVPVREQLVDRR